MINLNTWSHNILQKKSLNSDKMSFIVMGDSHLAFTDRDNKGNFILDQSGERYKKALEYIVSLTNKKIINPHFILHGGDLVHAGSGINFDIFSNVTKNVLGRINLPVFTSIGNHDYQISNLTTDAYQHHIGPERESFIIPGTKVKLIRLNSHFTGLQNGKIHEGYFSSDDLSLLPYNDMDYHYLINFHVPLRVCDYKNISDKVYFMSAFQTEKFLRSLNPNVCGIFTHHKHVIYRCNIDCEKYGTQCKIPFFISGCSGEFMCKSPYFIYVTLDLKLYNLIYKIYKI